MLERQGGGRLVLFCMLTTHLKCGVGDAKFDFACRAAHYRQLAAATLNEKIASSHLALANTFLQLSGDLRRMELTAARSAEEAE
jgi:hypothetical protein